jgi:hypothetical protein
MAFDVKANKFLVMAVITERNVHTHVQTHTSTQKLAYFLTLHMFMNSYTKALLSLAMSILSISV